MMKVLVIMIEVLCGKKQNHNMELYTNGLYIIKESLSKEVNPKDRRLIGHIIDINNKHKHVIGSAYGICSKINLPIYHTPASTEPQFKTFETLTLENRKEKIDSILNE